MKHKPPDMVLFFLVLILMALGIAMVLSASSSTALSLTHGDSYYFLKRQCVWLVIGFIGMVLAYRIDLHWVRAMSWWLYGGTLAVLSAVLIPHVGVVAGGARRWLLLGIIGVQPSELAKLVLVLFVAWFLTRKEQVSTSFTKAILPLIALSLPVVVLVFKEPDFGTSFLMLFTLGTMITISGVRLSHLVVLIASALPLGLIFMSSARYRMRRWSAFFHPWKDPLGDGYHIIQGLIALGSGGLFGAGLGAGRQKYFYLPEQHTDYIFAVLGEEGGLMATFFVLIVFVLIAARGMNIALKQKEAYAKLLASGLTVMIVGQAMLNMAMVMSLIPPVGVALPFVSYGGSSLFSAMIAVGFLLNLSRMAPVKKPDGIMQEKIFLERS